MYAYDTLTEAIADLRRRGFTLDFNLQENCLVCNQDRLNPDDFEITEFYRFEGPSDPADAAALYAIASHTGLKGLLVTGYGVSAEGMSAAMVKKLHFDL